VNTLRAFKNDGVNVSIIEQIDIKKYNVPLSRVLVDAKHGIHTHFELITATITCRNGEKGTGYTYTGGKGGSAIVAMLAVHVAHKMSADDVLEVLYPLLITHGMPHYIRSDNGPEFKADVFQKWLT